MAVSAFLRGAPGASYVDYSDEAGVPSCSRVAVEACAVFCGALEKLHATMPLRESFVCQFVTDTGSFFVKSLPAWKVGQMDISVRAGLEGIGPQVVVARRYLVDKRVRGIFATRQYPGDMLDALPLYPTLSGRVTFMMGVAQLVIGLHERVGVAHRDLKPENVLFGVDGTLRLTDFSSAPSRKGRRCSFTASYAAPEALLSAMRKSDEKRDEKAGDVFSLGVMLLECLTNHPFHESRKEPQRPLCPLRIHHYYRSVCTDYALLARATVLFASTGEGAAYQKVFSSVLDGALRADSAHRVSARVFAKKLREILTMISVQQGS